MLGKRLISIFAPIQLTDSTVHIFLQKRSSEAKVLPGYFGFWGGGCESGETPEEGLIREVQEELGIALDQSKVELFNHYEFLGSIKNIYIYYPKAGWEKDHVIGEGDYGKWFSIDEALKRDDIIYEDKVVLNDFERYFLKKPIK